ncbi:MAG: hypothetical protein LBR26_05510 [Prevotella sp.]|nr:hypothetical protein [Prevotella sp.]
MKHIPQQCLDTVVRQVLADRQITNNTLHAASVLDWSFYIRWEITIVLQSEAWTNPGQTPVFDVTRIHGRNFNLMADSTGKERLAANP